MQEDSLEAQAARWRIRRSDPDFTDQDSAAFETWISADPARAVAFAKVDRTWDLMESLRENDLPEPAAHKYQLSRRAMAAALVVAIGTGTLWLALDKGQTISTVIGEQRTVRLSDGSLVSLNTDTAIDLEFGANSRTLILRRGEAVFQVAKDPKRPWRVKVAGMQIEALGTIFGVRTNGADSRVLMLKGLVKITNPGRTSIKAYASTGDAALVSRSAVRVVSPRSGEIDRLLSWRQGVLEFSGQSVQQIAEEFNRYNTSKIIVVNPETAQLKFGGRFGTHEGHQFVEALCSGFPVRAFDGDDGNIYLTASSGDADHGVRISKKSAVDSGYSAFPRSRS
jgi:transmembrane sensor